VLERTIRRTTRVCLGAALALLAGAACNTLTGADSLVVAEGDDEPEDVASSSPGNGDGDAPDDAAVAAGAGGAGDPGGGHPSAPTAAATGSGGAPAGPSASSGGPTQCQYPAGPYGAAVGHVLPPTLSWQGFPENASQQTTVSITDYFDCDGSKGIHALLLITSATWCGVCQQEADVLEAETQGQLGALGARVITLMIENASYQPATAATAEAWKSNFGLVSSAVVADPEISMATSPSFGTPLEVVVDPRTMKVVDRQEGWAGDYPTLVALAQQNQ
jgi:hypothetical protein